MPTHEYLSPFAIPLRFKDAEGHSFKVQICLTHVFMLPRCCSELKMSFHHHPCVTASTIGNKREEKKEGKYIKIQDKTINKSIKVTGLSIKITSQSNSLTN